MFPSAFLEMFHVTGLDVHLLLIGICYSKANCHQEWKWLLELDTPEQKQVDAVAERSRTPDQ
jgi:hypothetical protein